MKLKFIRKKQETNDIWSFWFTPLESVSWIAGQSLRLEIPAGYDTDERRFTIASAPYEQEIMITTRLSDSVFKQGLEALQIGTDVDAFAIEGDFMWEEDGMPRLFVASGIGITPFRSMLLQRSYEDKPVNAKLIYATRSVDALFHDDLMGLGQDTSFIFNELHDQRVTSDHILQMPDIERHLIYLSGPSRMVDEIARGLRGQVPLVNIRKDRFTGNVV
jgi:ferredoxin-NADP reductase